MTPAQILEVFRTYKVPHERIAEAISRDRSVATKMLKGIRSVKVTEIEALTQLALKVISEHEGREIDRAAFQVRSVAGAAHAFQEPELERLRRAGQAPGALPIGHAVQAGAWLEVNALDQREPGYYPASPDPRYPRARQWLSPVIGDSMNALTKNGLPAGILDGDFAHVVDAIDIDYRPATGDVVEVERSRFDGREREVTLKQIEVGDDGEIELWPRSTNPAFAEPIPYRSGLVGAEYVEVRIRAKMLRVIRAY